jgi:hypothetical protein
MSVYPPPNYTEAITIFNTSNWVNTTSTTTTGLSPLVPSPAGSYTYMNGVVNEYGQLTSAVSTKYPNRYRYVDLIQSGTKIVYTFTLPVGWTGTNNINPYGLFFNWWIVQGNNTTLGNGYIGSNASYDWFLPTDMGYSYGSNRSTSVNIHVGLAGGIGFCNVVQPLDAGGNSITCPAFIKQFEYGTNPIVSIVPLLSVANNVPTYTITFTYTTAVAYSAMLFIQPLGNDTYPTEL